MVLSLHGWYRKSCCWCLVSFANEFASLRPFPTFNGWFIAALSMNVVTRISSMSASGDGGPRFSGVRLRFFLIRLQIDSLLIDPSGKLCSVNTSFITFIIVPLANLTPFLLDSSLLETCRSIASCKASFFRLEKSSVSAFVEPLGQPPFLASISGVESLTASST